MQAAGRPTDRQRAHLAPEFWIACDGVFVVVNAHQLCLIHCDGLVQTGTRIALQVFTVAVRPATTFGRNSKMGQLTHSDGGVQFWTRKPLQQLRTASCTANKRAHSAV
jgi:hypothetical protein